MPNAKRPRRERARRDSERVHPVVDCFVREVLPLLRRRRRASSVSERHLKNAAIEVLEAMRAFLGEGIAWLREEHQGPELRRIHVED
jgi:hypothetical protein